MNILIKTLGSLALLVVFNANAQKLEFDELVHDFGTIQEGEDSVTHAFKFTNTGDKPLIITKVQPSCGCTTSGWTKEPVKPGETGEVLATYRTSSGSFDKSLTVTTNGLPNVILHVKGNVIRETENWTEAYPQTFGDLMAKNKKDFSFAQISSQQSAPLQAIEVANVGDEVVNITFENVPEYINVNAVPASLNPLQKGKITVGVNGEKHKTFGYSKDTIIVKTGNRNEVFRVTSIVAEKIEQAETFPIIDIAQPNIDMGKITVNRVSGTIKVTNVGNADLVIKSCSADNNAFRVLLKNELKIKSGKTGIIKLSARDLQKGINVAHIYLSTNDPVRSLVRIVIKVEVE
jgi:hypothetical protein